MQISDSIVARFLSNSKSRKILKQLTLYQNLVSHTSPDLESAIGHQHGKPALQLEKFVYQCFHHCASFITNPDTFLNRIDESSLATLSLCVTEANQPAVISLLNQCTKLVDLKLKILPTECRQIFQAAATSPVMSILQLESINDDRSEFYAALENFIQNLAGRPCQLTELSLGTCNDNVVRAIVDRLRCLAKLDINVHNCGTDSMKQLLIKLKRLEVLRVQQTTSLMLVQLAPFIVELTNLKYFGIDISDANDGQLGYVDILSSFSPLKELRIQINRHENGHILNRLAKKGLPQLEQLHIRSFEDMDEKIVAFLRKLPGLRRLHIWVTHYAYYMSNSVLKAIGKSCPLLNELDIPFNGVDLIGILSIILGCRFLKRMWVRKDFENRFWRPHELQIAKYNKIVASYKLDSY